MKIKITVALVLATLALTVSGAAAAMSNRIPETLSQIQEPGSTSDFDTYSFQEPTASTTSSCLRPIAKPVFRGALPRSAVLSCSACVSPAPAPASPYAAAASTSSISRSVAFSSGMKRGRCAPLRASAPHDRG